MKTQNSIYAALPVLFGFFVMGFCDIVGISSDYVQRTFDWSPVMTGFVPSLVFIWFLFLGIPVGNLRLPLVACTPEEEQRIIRTLEI